MNTLADIMGMGSSRTESRGLIQDRQEYDNYVIDMQTKGKAPLMFAEWIKAGKPKAG